MTTPPFKTQMTLTRNELFYINEAIFQFKMNIEIVDDLFPDYLEEYLLNHDYPSEKKFNQLKKTCITKFKDYYSGFKTLDKLEDRIHKKLGSKKPRTSMDDNIRTIDNYEYGFMKSN